MSFLGKVRDTVGIGPSDKNATGLITTIVEGVKAIYVEKIPKGHLTEGIIDKCFIESLKEYINNTLPTEKDLTTFINENARRTNKDHLSNLFRHIEEKERNKFRISKGIYDIKLKRTVFDKILEFMNTLMDCKKMKSLDPMVEFYNSLDHVKVSHDDPQAIEEVINAYHYKPDNKSEKAVNELISHVASDIVDEDKATEELAVRYARLMNEPVPENLQLRARLMDLSKGGRTHRKSNHKSRLKQKRTRKSRRKQRRTRKSRRKQRRTRRR